MPEQNYSVKEYELLKQKGPDQTGNIEEQSDQKLFVCCLQLITLID